MMDDAAEISDSIAAAKGRAATLKLCAYVLGYPDAALRRDLAEALTAAKTYELRRLADVLRKLGETDALELEQAYVRVFDFAEGASLYLTAHEYGDDRQRGIALVELRKMLAAGGFEEAEGELPDHIPLLLEFLALAPVEKADGAALETTDLEVRLETVLRAVSAHIPAANVYHAVMTAVLGELGWGRPEAAEQSEATAASQREQPDLEDLPYPLTYT